MYCGFIYLSSTMTKSFSGIKLHIEILIYQIVWLSRVYSTYRRKVDNSQYKNNIPITLL